MATSDQCSLYIGTNDGLYVGSPYGGGYSAAPLGFQGAGPMRANVVIDVDNPSRLYAGTTRAGFFRSDDRGATWTELNLGLVYKDIWSIAQHPVTRTLYVGTSPAAIFASDNGGETWSQFRKLDLLPSTMQWSGPIPPHISRMKSIGLHAANPNLIYGAIEEGWAVRSLDGGETWEQIADGFDHDGHAVAIMPDNESTIIATGGKGMYRSEDRGDSWTLSNSGIEECKYTPAHLVVHPSRPNVLVTAVSRSGPPGWRRPVDPGVFFVRSEDQGLSWTMMREGLPEGYFGVPRALTGDPRNLDTYYAGMIDGAVWRSDDGAESFHQLLAGLPSVLSITVAAA
ncbi:MAG: WD40/YVTN/BNR-like repeat-containing protein [Chloroflexota bacterium]